MDEQNIFCFKCKVFVKKQPSRVKRHFESAKHNEDVLSDLDKKKNLIAESNGHLISNDANVNSVRCIPCANKNLITNTSKQLNNHLRYSNHKKYIQAYQQCVEEDATFDNWE